MAGPDCDKSIRTDHIRAVIVLPEIIRITPIWKMVEEDVSFTEVAQSETA
ncbi:hypothetical protein [Flexivirga meconopsidis]|nr:hypothetical protein [Flexivirga meconopsidis]